MFANAWEIYPVKPYELSYIIPVGEDLYPTYPDFEQVFVLAQATTDGTIININDPRTVGVDVTAPLDRGEVTGLSHIGKGTTVTANHPVQVQFIVGAPNSGHVFRKPQLYGGAQRVVVVDLLRPGAGFCRRV